MFYKDLLRFRHIWLGLAILWIILFHLPFDIGLLNYAKEIGYAGVDICIFASGIGCFYSLSADPDVGSFMKRRLKRLAPTYMLFMIVWLAYQCMIGRFHFQTAVGNLFSLQYFTGLGGSFDWYVGALFLFYLLAPYFVQVIKRTSFVVRLLFLVFLIVCTIPFWRATVYMISITRLPIFYIGMLFADICKKDKKLSGVHAAGLAVAFILGVCFLGVGYLLLPQLLWTHGLYWYPFILITPPLCVAISCLLLWTERIKLTKPLVAFLSLCGNYSFEIYLVHVFLVSFIPKLINTFDLSRFRYLIWAAGILLLIAGCFILRRSAALVAKLFHKKHSS